MTVHPSNPYEDYEGTRTASQTSNHPHQDLGATSGPGRRIRILLVEDDNDLRVLLVETLNRAGYEVVEARNGREAISLFRRRPADLVITDLLMPEKDGFETLMELRMETPAPKVLAISGGGEFPAEIYLRMAGRLGAARILFKPFSTAEFLSVVQKLAQTSE